jgi:hypothetical protein
LGQGITPSPPEVVRQYGPFFGDMEIPQRLLMRKFELAGYRWVRVTTEGRMILVEGWSSEMPPDRLPLAPELQGKLPEGWRVGK